MKNARGVVLLHVLIMLFTLAWISALLLEWTLSHAVTAKSLAESDVNRAALAALQSRVYSCLSEPTVPFNDCNATPDIDACLTGGLTPLPTISFLDSTGKGQARNIIYKVCPGTPPCKLLIGLCPQGMTRERCADSPLFLDCTKNPPLWK